MKGSSARPISHGTTPEMWNFARIFVNLARLEQKGTGMTKSGVHSDAPAHEHYYLEQLYKYRKLHSCVHRNTGMFRLEKNL